MEFGRNCLLIDEVLILSDLHLGRRDYSGVSLQEELFHLLQEVIRIKKPQKIILNGDIKDEIGDVNDKEWRDIKRLIDICSENSELIIVKGNHDVFLEGICKDKGIKLVDSYEFDGNLVCHGDKKVDFGDCKRVIIGHCHPAITLRRGRREEKFKCFLLGVFEGRELVMMPAFDPRTIGSNPNELIGVFGKKIDVSEFKVVVAEDEGMEFGRVKDLEKGL